MHHPSTPHLNVQYVGLVTISGSFISKVHICWTFCWMALSKEILNHTVSSMRLISLTDFQSALKGSTTLVNSYGLVATLTSHMRLYTGYNASIDGTYHSLGICYKALWNIKLYMQGLVQCTLLDSTLGNLKTLKFPQNWQNKPFCGCWEGTFQLP